MALGMLGYGHCLAGPLNQGIFAICDLFTDNLQHQALYLRIT